MRHLPLVLVAFMIAPIAIWMLIETVLIPGSASVFVGEQALQVSTLVVVTAAALLGLAWWMGRVIDRTR